LRTSVDSWGKTTSHHSEEEKGGIAGKTDSACVTSRLIVDESFSYVADTELLEKGWMHGSLASSGGNTILGKFDKNSPLSPYKVFAVPGDAESLIVEFDMYEIGFWDRGTGIANECGIHADCLSVIIAGEKINLGHFDIDVDEGSYDGFSPKGVHYLVKSDKSQQLFKGENLQKHTVTLEVPKSSNLYADKYLTIEFESLIYSTASSGFDNIKITSKYACPENPPSCPNCITLNFATAGDGSSLTMGDMVDGTWYPEYGIKIGTSARVFDTSSPGASDYLGSPNVDCPTSGPGAGSAGSQGEPYQNCVAQKNVLIDNDGKSITFGFANPSKIESIGLMNIDFDFGYINVTQVGGIETDISIANAGVNSVQQITVDKYDVVKMEVFLGDRGAVTDLGVCLPCDEPYGCRPVEKMFDQQCSKGQFSEERFKIMASDGNAVTFSVQAKTFFSDLSRISMWFPDPTQDGDFCWEFDGTGSATSNWINVNGSTDFTAKCENGWATISIAGGDGGTGFQRFIDNVDSPSCKDGKFDADDPYNYNGEKRCLWEVQLPCRCDPTLGSRLLVSENTSGTSAATQQKANCEEDSKAVDVARVQVDKCLAKTTENPLKIVSQKKKTVEVALSQVWKGCTESESRLSWIAADYVGADGELACTVFSDLPCGLTASFTAVCQDSATVVDLYTYDAESNIFGQSDETPLVVPLACGATGDGTKMCHFRYIIQCEPSLCRPATVPARRLGSKSVTTSGGCSKSTSRNSRSGSDRKSLWFSWNKDKDSS
jgi:hypothetical protein